MFGNTTSTAAARRQRAAAEHNDIIGGARWGAGRGGRDAGRMRGFDGQGRGRAIPPRAAASAGSSCAPSLEKQLNYSLRAKCAPSSRVPLDDRPAPHHTCKGNYFNYFPANSLAHNKSIRCVMFVITALPLYMHRYFSVCWYSTFIYQHNRNITALLSNQRCYRIHVLTKSSKQNGSSLPSYAIWSPHLAQFLHVSRHRSSTNHLHKHRYLLIFWKLNLQCYVRLVLGTTCTHEAGPIFEHWQWRRAAAIVKRFPLKTKCAVSHLCARTYFVQNRTKMVAWAHNIVSHYRNRYMHEI